MALQEIVAHYSFSAARATTSPANASTVTWNEHQCENRETSKDVSDQVLNQCIRLRRLDRIVMWRVTIRAAMRAVADVLVFTPKLATACRARLRNSSNSPHDNSLPLLNGTNWKVVWARRWAS